MIALIFVHINYLIVGESISKNYVCLKGHFCNTSTMWFIKNVMLY